MLGCSGRVDVTMGWIVAIVLSASMAAPGMADQPESENAALPNIIVILADDLGYGDVQPNQPESPLKTPAFNRLAREGVVFEDAHSGSGVCTPTRYGLICGRYCWRTSLKRGVLGGYSKPLIQPGRQTIATVLKKAGYHTGCVGKWHLGLGWQWRGKEPDNINFFGIAGQKDSVDYSQPLTDGPLQHGFDECLIIPASLDMSPYVFIENDRVTQPPKSVIDGRPFPAFYRKGEISADFQHIDCLGHLADRACEFIAQRAATGEPFFLYFPMPAPHKPVIPTPEFQGASQLGPYGDFVLQVDSTVNRVLKAIDQAGIADNTLLVVTSDNGSFMHRYDKPDQRDHTDDDSIQGYRATSHRANGPLRGTKADVFEAGHRVPFMVRWPAQIKAGGKVQNTVCLTDLLATCAAAANVEFDQVSAEDSFSFLPLVVSSADAADYRRPPVINHSANGMFAIRQGPWKLILGNGSGGRAQPRGKPFTKPYQLYDLSQDLGESNNLWEQQTSKASELESLFVRLAHDDHQQ